MASGASRRQHAAVHRQILAMHGNHRRSMNLFNPGLANRKLAHLLGAGHSNHVIQHAKHVTLELVQIHSSAEQLLMFSETAATACSRMG